MIAHLHTHTSGSYGLLKCWLLAEAGLAAELRFTNLLIGRVVPVTGTGTERRPRIALASLPAGQYAYQLVVEGQPAASPQRLTVNP